MNRYVIFLAGCALLALSAAAASADCAEDLAAMEGGTVGAAAREGIAKDGSLAPLQSEADASTSTGATAPADGGFEAASSEPAGTNGIAKDGSLAPLASDEDDAAAGANVAMSAQDAQAQQEGGETAAQIAGGGDPARTDALARARAAIAAGDEAGCAAALKEAEAL